MKQRIMSLLALFCLLLSLAACNGGSSANAPSQGETESPAVQEETLMTEEEYQNAVNELNADIGTAMSSMGELSAADEASFRQGIETMRSMVEPFRTFAAITNPPEAWADAHAKIAEGCTGFADAMEGLCDSAEGMLDGEMTTEDYNNAVVEYTTGLTEASALLTEGFGMIET